MNLFDFSYFFMKTRQFMLQCKINVSIIYLNKTENCLSLLTGAKP